MNPGRSRGPTRSPALCRQDTLMNDQRRRQAVTRISNIPLDLEAHRQLAGKLAETSRMLAATFVTLANHYGDRHPVTRRAHGAMNQVDDLRADMDDQLSFDHPLNYTREIYFPGASRHEPGE